MGPSVESGGPMGPSVESGGPWAPHLGGPWASPPCNGGPGFRAARAGALLGGRVIFGFFWKFRKIGFLAHLTVPGVPGSLKIDSACKKNRGDLSRALWLDFIKIDFFRNFNFYLFYMIL